MVNGGSPNMRLSPSGDYMSASGHLANLKHQRWATFYSVVLTAFRYLSLEELPQLASMNVRTGAADVEIRLTKYTHIL